MKQQQWMMNQIDYVISIHVDFAVLHVVLNKRNSLLNNGHASFTTHNHSDTRELCLNHKGCWKTTLTPMNVTLADAHRENCTCKVKLSTCKTTKNGTKDKIP